MRAADVLLCLVCVGLGSTGQVLLRTVSMAAARSAQPGLAGYLTGTTALAVVVYASGMLLWAWVLSRVPLTQAFAFFGLSFVVVPLMSHRWLGDPLTPYTWAGAVVIMFGIALTNWPVR
jgi:undecaprenyl phosphate-alpha-L-ara4N flippase subunit ArnE